MFSILLILTVLPLLALGFTAWNRSLKASHLITLTAAAGHLAATFYALIGRPAPLPGDPWFALDPLGVFFLLIVSHTFMAVVLCSPGFLARMGDPRYQASRRLYYPALNLYLLANTLVIVTQHFGLLWVVLELTTFGLAPLIYFYRSKESLEAAWKYLFLVSLGLVFLLIGILFLGLAAKSAPGHPNLLVSELLRHAAQLNPLWIKASFVFALVGVSAKIGLAPMHPADIDATSNAPAPVAALMSGSLRSTAMLVLLRFYQIVYQTEVRPFAQHLLMAVGAFSLLVAAVYIWRSRNYKRLLAYSSVEHLGVITLAVGVGGVALLGGLLHTLFNSLGKVALFTMAGRVHHTYQSRQIESVRGLMRRMPWSGFLSGWPSSTLSARRRSGCSLANC
ncbi:MAG: proton-conducting transporter membrane subunit [Chthoniobacteraceae bacterium]|nr:proton-conducting transporter membrane subunit [Chthoniobacteraceae bacterium]